MKKTRLTDTIPDETPVEPQRKPRGRPPKTPRIAPNERSRTDSTETPHPGTDCATGRLGAQGQSGEMTGIPRRGAPIGNSNNMRHGLRGGKLPKGCQHIENAVNSLRRQVEAALLEAKGAINITDAAAINSVLKWERHGLLAAHWLRKEGDKLSVSDRLKFSEAIARASDNRDKALRQLDLERDPVVDAWTLIDATPVEELGVK